MNSKPYAPQSDTRKDKVQSWKKTREYIASIESLPVEKDDIPMQKQYCREFAESQGWTIIKEFAEKGVSGFKVAAADRDAIQEIRHCLLYTSRCV